MHVLKSEVYFLKTPLMSYLYQYMIGKYQNKCFYTYQSFISSLFLDNLYKV